MVTTDGTAPVMLAPSYGNGDCGGMGGSWIWAFLLFALLGNGGWGNNRNYNGNDEIWKAQEFNQLENSVRATNNGICDSSYALNNSIKDGNYAIQSAVQGVNQNIGNALCSTTYELAGKIDRVGTDLQSCCCSINRSIDATNFNNERNTNAIIQNSNAGTQKILDWLCCNEKNQLSRELSDSKQALSEARIITSMKPVAPIPAYTVQNPYTTYYGNSCGCNSNLL